MSQASHERELEPGTVVAGKLRVVRTLGVGGMGAVYEVEHALTKHRRALKILHRRISQSAAVVARFQREASAAARIGNPHISETFDAGTLETGEAYLLMELLQGETLDARLQRAGPFDPTTLTELVVQACDGVQAAHEAGIVHRDLKPENLFLTTRDGRPFVKVLDFGISKFERENGAMGITAEGAVMGTPFYMPPEQVRGLASIDLRADIYSLGVILYECACGTRPYTAQTIEQLAILIHEGKAVPLLERRGDLPRSFCDVVMRAMAVDRDVRFPTAKALADALSSLMRVSILPPRAQGSDPPRVVVGTATDGQTALGGTIPAMIPSTERAPAPNTAAATAGVRIATPVVAATLAAGALPTTATASPVSDTMPPPAAPRRSATPIAILVVGGAAVAAFLVFGRAGAGGAGGAAPTAGAAVASTSASPTVATTSPAHEAAPTPFAQTSANGSGDPDALGAMTDAGAARLPTPTRRLPGPGGVQMSVNQANQGPSALPSALLLPPSVKPPPIAAPSLPSAEPPTRAQVKGLAHEDPYAKP